MPKNKIDGVIEAVRFSNEGLISQVRVYERRGSAFTDRTILTRVQLLERLKSGKRFATGDRVPNMGNSFTLKSSVHLIQEDRTKRWISTQPESRQDQLEHTPLF